RDADDAVDQRVAVEGQRRPLDADADPDEVFAAETGGPALPLNRDALIYGIIGIAALAILFAVFL
ncbi:MAG: hypothetical protein ACKO8X_08465, partial [Verrucomicrobiota bacterium]